MDDKIPGASSSWPGSRGAKYKNPNAPTRYCIDATITFPTADNISALYMSSVDDPLI